MNVRDTFINLTRMTYPYGHEEMLTDFLPKGFKTDEDGNYYFEIGNSKNIFTSHLDTACKAHTKVIHKFDGRFIRTNGTTILGADDKAGVTILLYMIHHKVPGLYYFFIGEEVGCIGSTAAAKRVDFFSKYNKMISFDRRGTQSIITHQSSRRTCSDDFADSLSKEFKRLGMKLSKDDTGVYTDSAEFVDVIPECTNISVGYYSEHTHSEHQDIEFLTALAETVVMIDWDNLEVKRDCTKTEYKDYSNDYYYYGGSKSWSGGRNTCYAGFNGGYSTHKKTRRGKKKDYDWETNSWWSDEEFYGNNGRTRDFYYHNGKKIYYDDVENEMMKIGDNSFVSKELDIPIDTHIPKSTFNFENHLTDYYKGVRDMYLDDNLTKAEFSIVKEQCLNMLDDSDRDFVKFMESTLPVTNDLPF